MAQLLVRNLEDRIKDRLKQRAARNGRSMEEEAREILRAALATDKQRPLRLGTFISEQFAGLG